MDNKTVYPPFAAEFDAEEARENNLIGQKLSYARKSRNYTIAEMSRKLAGYGIDASRSAVNRWELGINIPNGYQLMALCSALGIEDLSFFRPGSLNEAGFKKLLDYRDDLIATGLYAPEQPANEIIYIDRRIYALPASAGTGSFLDSEEFEVVSLPADSVPKGADFGIRVSGDSMEPIYNNGQIVWVRSCESLRPGQVGIFVLDGCAYIKQYSEQPPEFEEDWTDVEAVLHQQPVLVSYNKKYAPIVVGRESSLIIAGRVLS